MSLVKHLRRATALIGVATLAAMIGDAISGDSKPKVPVATGQDVASSVETVEKFAKKATVTYKLDSGETVFAWQFKPTLARSAQPRDILILVDTSASQAGNPLDQARTIVDTLSKELGADDRIDIWTINVDQAKFTRSLTDGFKGPRDAEVEKAVTTLRDVEYCSGAVDLKSGVERAAKQFSGAGRTRSILFLGDGESAGSMTPFSATDRQALGNLLAEKEIRFFAVPIGPNINAQNLHGLTAATGGTLIRISDATRSEFATKVRTVLDVPVLHAARAVYGPEGLETFPKRLPPIRGDRATLIVGKAPANAKAITLQLDGQVSGTKTTLNASETLSASEDENYYLNAMFAQWKNSPNQEAPALLAADRTLAQAEEQFRLYRDEFTLQASWAIGADRLDHADKLYKAAAEIDPRSAEAAAGTQLVKKIREGRLDPNKVKRNISKGQTARRMQEESTEEGAKPEAKTPSKEAPKTDAPKPAAEQPTQAEKDLVAQAKAAQTVVEQEYRILVDETLRRGRKLLASDPDSAYEDLKRQRDSVLSNDQLSDAARRKMVQDIDTVLREIQSKGAEIKRRLASERSRIAESRQRLNDYDRMITQQERDKERVRQFKDLMKHARFELAQQEAQVMIQEQIARALPVLPEAHAAYRIGQSATNVREMAELRRIRQDRFLRILMSAEKSGIPYPDEPPIHYPPAAVWRELTQQRAERFRNTSLGSEPTPEFKRVRSLLEGETGRVVKLEALAPGSGATRITLSTLLSALKEEFKDYGVRFSVRADLFEKPEEGKSFDPQITLSSNLAGLPLGTFLDSVLRDNEMCWIARPEHIEIGPNTRTFSLRYDEKVTRVFDVAELALAVPQSVNNSTLQQNLNVISQQMTIFGTAFNPFAGANINTNQGFGGINPFNGQFGGGNNQGNQQFGGNNRGFGGNASQNFQGGGLTGQFGIQGNDQSQVLVQLITTVVALNEWDSTVGGVSNQPNNPQPIPASSPEEAESRIIIPNGRRNSIGFYPPARAMIMRATHRYHPTPSFKLKWTGEGAGAAQADRKNDKLAKNDKSVDKLLAEDIVRKSGKSADKVWNEAFASAVTKPKLIVDAIDSLFEMGEFGHASEALKAGLRKGRMNEWWLHDALTVALKSDKADPAEIERAALSAVDLDPKDATCYLKVASTEDDLGRPEVALAFCKRAARLEPNDPLTYSNALAYAEKSTDISTDAVHWASVNLLSRDWAQEDGADYHVQTRDRIRKIADRLNSSGQKDAANKLRASVEEETTRDLVIELRYQGPADLDLEVREPSGSIATATHKATTGGGLLKADIIEQVDDDRSEIYTAAQAFAGNYVVTVKKVTGRPTGDRATIKVTRYQGTKDQEIQTYSVDLADPRPIDIRLERGSRSELVLLPPQELTSTRLETTQAGTANTQGINAGTAAGGENLLDSPAGTKRWSMPLVNPTMENRVADTVPGLPEFRVESKLSSDRTKIVASVKTVFTGGPAKDIPMPKFALIPGGE